MTKRTAILLAFGAALAAGCARQADDDDWVERSERACANYCQLFFACPSPNLDFFGSEEECYDTCAGNYISKEMPCPEKSLRMAECVSELTCDDFIFAQSDSWHEESPCRAEKFAWSECAGG